RRGIQELQEFRIYRMDLLPGKQRVSALSLTHVTFSIRHRPRIRTRPRFLSLAGLTSRGRCQLLPEFLIQDFVPLLESRLLLRKQFVRGVKNIDRLDLVAL